MTSEEKKKIPSMEDWARAKRQMTDEQIYQLMREALMKLMEATDGINKMDPAARKKLNADGRHLAMADLVSQCTTLIKVEIRAY